jgi:hypothetical protein
MPRRRDLRKTWHPALGPALFLCCQKQGEHLNFLYISIVEGCKMIQCVSANCVMNGTCFIRHCVVTESASSVHKVNA